MTTEFRLIKRGDSRTIPRTSLMRSLGSTLLCCLALVLAVPQAVAENTTAKSADNPTDSTSESATAMPEVEAIDSGESAELTVRPVPGELSSEFGLRSDPVRRKRRRRRRTRMHKGLDFIAGRGTHVRAAGPGVVIRAQVTGSYGRLVIIDHGGGLQTRYAHLQRFRVRKGQRIEAGRVIGHVGSSGRVTGPHLHFEVRQDGEAVSPKDVVKFRVPKCAKTARRCKSIAQPPRSRTPNS